MNKLLILLCLFFCISLFCSLHESLTYDEIVHIQEGENALLHHTFAIDTNNPPFEREFATLPLVFHSDSFIHSPLPLLKDLPARIMIVFLSIILGIALFVITKHYFGKPIAYISLLLFIFDPNILANNHYVTFDIGFTLFFFLSYVIFLKILHGHQTSKSFRYYLQTWGFLSLTIGLGLASKISFIPFFLISASAALMITKQKQSFLWVWQHKIPLISTFVLSLFFLWATYFFRSDIIIAQRADTGRVSYKLEQYAKAHHNHFMLSLLHIGENQPIPLGNYIAMIKNNAIRNTEPYPYFFLGKFYPNHQWYFLLGNVLFKTPIPLLLFLCITLFFILWQQNKLREIISYPLEKEIPLRTTMLLFLIPIIVILFVGSVTNLFPWVRYVLPIYPFIDILAAVGIFMLMQKPIFKYISLILVCWYIIGTLVSLPHPISYTNELLGIKQIKNLLFIDSNIDWGEAIPDLTTYIQKTKPKQILFSYFGRDSADLYGLKSSNRYDSYKLNDICAFHTITMQSNKKEKHITAISLSNWYYCGYYKKTEYLRKNIKDIIGGSIVIF